MLLPSKHISFSKSLLGYGGYLLSKIEGGKSVDELYQLSKHDYEHNRYPSKQSFDNLILTLLFLYSIGAVEEHNGVVMLCG